MPKRKGEERNEMMSFVVVSERDSENQLKWDGEWIRNQRGRDSFRVECNHPTAVYLSSCKM